MSGGDVAFEADVEDDDTPRALAPADALGDTSLDPGRLIFEADEANDRARQLRDALSVLDHRSRSIIEARWLGEREDKSTLGDLADKYGVSAERIRQIEKRAMEQMRTTVSA
jgi:RNA polymerase sigma-32 factor